MPPKRKNKIQSVVSDSSNTLDNTQENKTKKRGRKPRGGKIVDAEADGLAVQVPEPNVILHLRCGRADLNDNNRFTRYTPYNNDNSISSNTQSGDSLLYSIIDNNVIDDNIICSPCNNDNDNDNKQTLWNKLEKLAVDLHTNNISDKKSACFWDSCDFDSPPIYIPKFTTNNTYYCYGCFCSPECAAAYLFRETLDTATRFERYAMLNHLYCKIYDYKKNIKPAPDPYHTLDKFYGNLSIQEYRRHLKSERILLVVDKPLTRMLPELHEDNDEFVMNTSNNSSVGHFKLRRNKKKPSKAEVLAENFGMK